VCGDDCHHDGYDLIWIFCPPGAKKCGNFKYSPNFGGDQYLVNVLIAMPDILLPAPPSTTAKKSRTRAPEQEIIDYISKFMPLTEVEIRGILDNINLKTFKKGTVLVREGQISNVCYFIMKGCIRQYYLKDGEEITTNFYTEGQPVTPFEGAFKSKPSRFYLSCVENCILSAGTPEDEAKLMEQFPQFKGVVRVAVEEELGKSQEILSSYIINSPEERYLHLLKTRPELLDRVPQYQLASYLGIKPESLSRIRKRIMAK
jgi:CRP-like cAMP-binding protein